MYVHTVYHARTYVLMCVVCVCEGVYVVVCVCVHCKPNLSICVCTYSGNSLIVLINTHGNQLHKTTDNNVYLTEAICNYQYKYK